MAGSRVLRHLRGTLGDQQFDLTAIDGLLRGYRDVPQVIGDPSAYFSRIVLTDFDRTYELLVALVKEAQVRVQNGVRGFRAGSPMLRKEAREAIFNADRLCVEMGMAWKGAGLVAEELPEWLRAGIDAAVESPDPDATPR